MTKFIFFLFLLFPFIAKTDIIKCSGNLGFWIDSPTKKWNRIDLNQKFTGHSSDFSTIHVGQYQKFPAVKIYPFQGISYIKISSEIKIVTDNETYFSITGNKNKKLHCEISSEAAF